MWWPTAASISCKTIRKLSCLDSLVPDSLTLANRTRESLIQEKLLGAALLESVNSVYFETGCHGAADGSDSAGGRCQLHAVAGLGIAAGRLPNDSSTDVLSRSEPGRGCDHGDGSAGATVRPTSGTKPNDFQQFGRDFRYRAAI